MKRFAILATCALFAVACTDSTAPPVATKIVLSTPTVSLDAIGATQAVTATVLDQHDQLMASSTVTWTASTAAASVAPDPVATKPTATITALLNGASLITATSGKASATITVTTVQTPAIIQKMAGDAQSGAVNTQLAQAISVRVTDRLGTPITGQSLTFSITQGGGAVSPTNVVSLSVVSAGDGVATTTWTLGKVALAAQQLAVGGGGVTPITFSATAVAGPPVAIAIASGDGQTGQVGSVLPVVPSVLVSDAFANLVSGAVVTFTPVGGGSVATPSTTTNAAGIAFAGTWTLGTTPGAKSLTVSIGGTTPLSISATALVGPPVSTVIVAGNNQSATVGTALSTSPSVRVVDAFGNGVTGIAVTFSILNGGGSVSPATRSTDAAGLASTIWTLGPAFGTNTFTATAAGLSAVTFTATGLPAGGTAPTPGVNSEAILSGNSQSAMAGAAVLTPPAVVVRDGAGNPIPGVPVQFAVASGGGSITGAATITNASGTATVGSWTLGTAGALNTLTATASASVVPGGAVTFTAAGCEGDGGAGYAITVCYRSAMTATQKQAFVDAAARWRSVITADVGDVNVDINPGDCDRDSPSIHMAIDDLLIFASIEPIDGTGNILGSAGWCYRRTAGLPIIGSMRFDVADVAGLETTGRLGAVILHEMGHVLGVGTMWTVKGLLQNPSTSASKLDTYFSGPGAIAGFDLIGGTTYTGGLKVPVENTGGSGTMNAHWRESVLANELMTGFLNSGSNPLSVMTVRSLEDVGYTVNAAGADPFLLTLSLQALRAPDPFALKLEGDSFTGKQWTIDTRGRMTRVR